MTNGELDRTIRTLTRERDALTRVIEQLEALRDGEPLPLKEQKRRGRKFMAAAERAEVSERMKKYWNGVRAKKGNA